MLTFARPGTLSELFDCKFQNAAYADKVSIMNLYDETNLIRFQFLRWNDYPNDECLILIIEQGIFVLEDNNLIIASCHY